jgi:hypothetical protein
MAAAAMAAPVGHEPSLFCTPSGEEAADVQPLVCGICLHVTRDAVSCLDGHGRVQHALACACGTT